MLAIAVARKPLTRGALDRIVQEVSAGAASRLLRAPIRMKCGSAGLNRLQPTAFDMARVHPWPIRFAPFCTRFFAHFPCAQTQTKRALDPNGRYTQPPFTVCGFAER